MLYARKVLGLFINNWTNSFKNKNSIIYSYIYSDNLMNCFYPAIAGKSSSKSGTTFFINYLIGHMSKIYFPERNL